jgi:hypothetical protein
VASFTRRAVITRHIEYLIPIGSSIDVWDQAATAALREWESLHPGNAALDDWATVHTDDEHVIIRITIREVERSG